MQAAKEAVKEFIHHNRSPERRGDRAGERSERSRLDQAERERLERSERERTASERMGVSDTSRTSATAADTSRTRTVGMETSRSGYDTSRHGEEIQIDPTVSTKLTERKADTEVREIVNPAITKEVVIEENREETITAVDRELHQDHYQTRVQPIIDKQVLPEEHIHRTMPVEYKERKHHKEEEIRRALEEERSRFKSTREVLPTRYTVHQGETTVGEHHHHHVYETVQPVIEREIIQPTVTHTTIPIHEHIEKDPTFHPKTIQPVMTMEEFLRAGGTFEGRAERMDVFEGEPQVMENGGADVTHPNAWDARGHHLDSKGNVVDSRGNVVKSATERTGPTTTTTTTTRIIEVPRRTGSPLTAAERERIMQGPTGRTRSPLASPGLHTTGRQ